MELETDDEKSDSQDSESGDDELDESFDQMCNKILESCDHEILTKSWTPMKLPNE